MELGGRERVRERLEKSWVVEGPITVGGCQRVRVDWIGGWMNGGGGRGVVGERKDMRTDFIRLSIHKRCSSCQSLLMDLSGLLGDIVGGAELDVCFFEVGFYTTQAEKRELYQHS